MVGLCAVLAIFLGLFWVLLGPPWCSVGCLGVSLPALVDHFGFTLLDLGLPGPLVWRAMAAFLESCFPLSPKWHSGDPLSALLAPPRGLILYGNYRAKLTFRGFVLHVLATLPLVY